jgi:hypothetical protein
MHTRYTTDEQEQAEVARILAALPKGHPARKAFAAGEPTWNLARLVRDRLDLVVKLANAIAAREKRALEKSTRGAFKSPAADPFSAR